MRKGQENLIPLNKRTKEEQRKIQQMGGVASGISRGNDATVKKMLGKILKFDVKKIPALKKIAKAYGISEDDSVKELACTAWIINSLKNGDLENYKKLADILGENEENNKNNGILDKLEEILKNEK